nr:L-type lectin-domain containing receptor kinase S.4-like [Ipomoea batatas]
MAERLLIFVCLLCWVARNGFSMGNEEFFFSGFGGEAARANMSLDGAAEIQKNGILKLTNTTARRFGHAFYSNPVDFKDRKTGKGFSFSTAFAFGIVPQFEKLGGHGFAFVISRSRELKGVLPNQYLGLMNATDFGNFSNHLLAVEFDTVQDFEFGDISDNHVGVDINSMVSNASANVSFFPGEEKNPTKEKNSLQCGKKIQAWVDYDSSKNQLNVTLSLSSTKPDFSVLSFQADLSPILEENMFVGFSASTGVLASSHYIFGWSFKMNGQAQSLDLSSLPSLPGPPKSHMPMILATSLSSVTFIVVIACIVVYIVFKLKNMDVIEPWELEVGPHRNYDEIEAVILLKLGLVCSNSSPEKRPTMRQVMRYLEGDAALPETVESPNEYGKKDGNNAASAMEFGDFLSSYPPSSFYEEEEDQAISPVPPSPPI